MNCILADADTTFATAIALCLSSICHQCVRHVFCLLLIIIL